MAVETNPHFLELVKNTLEDFQKQSFQSEETRALQEIYMTKKVDLLTATCLYTIIENRKSNISFVKKNQDKATFKLINKEHKYMENFLNRFFINNLEIIGSHITGFVSVKDMEEVA